jgi:hypothetical protein
MIKTTVPICNKLYTAAVGANNAKRQFAKQHRPQAPQRTHLASNRYEHFEVTEQQYFYLVGKNISQVSILGFTLSAAR